MSRPQPLWSEQAPQDWWKATQEALGALKDKVSLASLKGVGIAGQMHGAVMLDEAGEPVRPAILWNDGRSGPQCAQLEKKVPALLEIAGNRAMPGFTAPKLLGLRKIV